MEKIELEDEDLMNIYQKTNIINLLNDGKQIHLRFGNIMIGEVVVEDDVEKFYVLASANGGVSLDGLLNQLDINIKSNKNNCRVLRKYNSEYYF